MNQSAKNPKVAPEILAAGPWAASPSELHPFTSTSSPVFNLLLIEPIMTIQLKYQQFRSWRFTSRGHLCVSPVGFAPSSGTTPLTPLPRVQSFITQYFYTYMFETVLPCTTCDRCSPGNNEILEKAILIDDSSQLLMRNLY